MEAVRQPRRTVLVEVPADGIGAMLTKCLHGVNGIALGLAHLAAVLILYMTEHDDILIWCFIKKQRGNGNQRIEPAAGLVNGLGDEISRETLLKNFLVLKRIMPLGKRHGTGVEPAVDNFRYTVHFLTTFRAFDGHGINVRTVQFDIVRAVVAHFLEFGNGANRVLMTAFAFPNRQRRAPVTVTGQAPILYMFEPVTETAFADGFRNPVDLVVVGNELVFDIRHLDEPGFTRIVDQRRITAPAVRIAVLKLRRLKELAALFEVVDNQRVSVFDKYAGPVRFFRHFALVIDELHERHIVLAADAVIVLTESRGDMNDTRTIGRRYIIITNHEEGLFLELADSVIIERLIFAVFEVLAFAFREDFALTFHTVKDRIHEGFGQIVYRTVNLDFYIIHIGIYAEAEVGGQCPGRSRPGKEISVFVLDLELHHRGAFLDIFIALRYFVGRQRRAAARAVRYNLMALVEQALLPYFLERPPFGFNEVVFVSDVGMFHVSPETDHIGKFFPHAFVFPNRLTALLDERLNAVFFNLFLAVDAHEFFHFELYRQTVRIPAGLS